MPKIELLPCPFCGKLETLRMMHVPFEKRECVYHVVCDAVDGGCGASTGWNHETPEDAAKEWNTRASGWIPCGERMPKVRTDVLLQFEQNMCVGFYSGGLWNVNSGNGFYTAVLESEDQPVAWMPLPEPPHERKDT